VQRQRVSRFASTIVAFALVLGLAACGGNSIVPASLEMPQFPGSGPPPSPGREALPAPASAGPIKVALLVPLSGPNTELGKSMLEAAQLALFTTGSERLTLVPRDSSGSPDGAAAAARSALSEGAKLIVGPLLAAEVEAVKPVARDAHVNIIAFSTATQLAGGNTFLMGFLPRQEVAREVAVAHEKGLNRFAALVPNSQYGHLMVDALREAVATVGGTVAKAEYLDPGDPTPAIKRLLSVDTAAAGPGSPPAPDFDALLLPEGDGPLKQIAHQLRAAGLDTAKVRLLGSGLWDDPSIAGEPGLYGGWFAASPPEPEQEFENRFQKTYGRPAPRLASLAFDAAALAAVLAQNGGGGHPFSREAILNASGFTGVDGLFRFTSQGLVQRGLAVLEVGPQGNTVVSPAPQNFQDLAY
jgi:ABC-type branched-subunit amino acid transport system substrate-binding protein